MAVPMQRAVIASILVLMWGRGFAQTDSDEAYGEREETLHDMIQDFDKDGDEKISLDEALVGLKETSPDDSVFFEKNAPIVFKQADDGDNMLSGEEFDYFLESLSDALEKSEV
eukprot:TRINITY_DN68863_c0_g1_i1.p1 TRINITY_DN68863_c0_g1~~TRINITY_DN68863_c0_g1_i1.p1  ORF type:complete len:113 (+),score=22.40 TRINITY_DN68863_c0_g1_i1:49-387(+)